MEQSTLHFPFYGKNTFLHSCFKTQTADKLFNLVHSKYVAISMFITIVIYQIWAMRSLGLIEYVFYKIFVSLSCTLWILFCIIWLLSCNKEATFLIIKGFEFWIKMGYAVLYQVTRLIFIGYAHKYRNVPLCLNCLFENLFIGIAFVFGVCCVSLFDAVNTNRFGKILVCIAFAVACTWYTIFLQWLFPIYYKDYIEFYAQYELPMFGVTLLQLYTVEINALRICALFLWKQGILTGFREKSKKAVLIQCIPTLEWREGEIETDENNDYENRQQPSENDIDGSRDITLV